jgi:GntR family transcriptional repressor for pyruvate dehydrogenase complex
MSAHSEFRPPPRLPKASDVLATQLRLRILSEGLGPGDSLPAEAELIEEYQFSRGTVREALRLLEADGLVRVRRGAGGGVEVTKPDGSAITESLALLFAFQETTLDKLIAFRLIVEPPAAAIAARDATPRQRQRLIELANPSLVESVDFHRALGEATNNDILKIILMAVDQLTEWHTRREVLGPGDFKETALAHASIAQAISTGDERAAEKAMRRHLVGFRSVLEAQNRLTAPIIARPSVAAATRRDPLRQSQ